MQISRSVIMATTLPASSTTGTAPQSFSHMIRAGSLRESVIEQVCTLDVMTSRTFMMTISLCQPWRQYALGALLQYGGQCFEGVDRGEDADHLALFYDD